MAVDRWLIDKSAYALLSQARDVQKWIDRIEQGLVHISVVTRLEIGYSFRTADQARTEPNSPPLSRMPISYLTPAVEDRAMEVQVLLAERGQHRAPSIPDLLVAATAEKARLTVLARDKDFALIADITGQQIETLALR